MILSNETNEFQYSGGCGKAMEALVGSGKQLQGSVNSGDALGALGRPERSAELCGAL